MTDKDYIKIPRSIFENDLFTSEPFSKMQAWLDLIFLALPEDKDFYMRGTLIHGKKGVAYISRGMLAKRWGWSDKKVVRFLDKLIATQLATQPTTQPSSWLTSCISIANYGSLVGGDPTYDPTNDPTPNQATQLATQPTTQLGNSITSSNTTICGAEKNQATQPMTQPTTQLGKALQEKENKEKEKRKKISPIPPIKEINKEKEKKEKELSTPPIVGVGTTRVHACACEENDLVLTCEVSKEQEKKPTKKNPSKEYTLTYRARLVFDEFYKEHFKEPYYFSEKEMTMLKSLLKKLKFSRQNKEKPMPVDDDSMIAAFSKFISLITDNWILDRFSISNINSKYNELVMNIKNSRNGTSVNKTTNNIGRYQSDYDRGRAQCEALQKDFAAQLEELEYKLKTKQIIPPSEQPEGGRTEIELPDF